MIWKLNLLHALEDLYRIFRYKNNSFLTISCCSPGSTREGGGWEQGGGFCSCGQEVTTRGTVLTLNIINRMLEMTYSAQTNAENHVTTNIDCQHSLWYTNNNIDLLIGSNDVVGYDVTKFPAFCLSKHHFRWHHLTDRLLIHQCVGLLKVNQLWSIWPELYFFSRLFSRLVG